MRCYELEYLDESDFGAFNCYCRYRKDNTLIIEIDSIIDMHAAFIARMNKNEYVGGIYFSSSYDGTTGSRFTELAKVAFEYHSDQLPKCREIETN